MSACTQGYGSGSCGSPSLSDLGFEVTQLRPIPGDIVVVRYPESLSLSDLRHLFKQLDGLAEAFGCKGILLPKTFEVGCVKDFGGGQHNGYHGFGQRGFDVVDSAFVDPANPVQPVQQVQHICHCSPVDFSRNGCTCGGR